LKKLLFLLGFSIVTNLSFGQQKLLEVRHIKTDAYPNISADLWVRNPDGINKDAVKFFEETSLNPVKVEMGNPAVVTDSLAKNKCVVFLVLNPGAYGKNELQWYKTVIKQAIRKGAIKKGDKIEVLNFNNENAGQLLYPNKISFTDDTAVVFSKLDAIVLRETHCLCSSSNNRSLIYQAINQTLDQLEKQYLNIPAGVFVLADDRACLPGSTGETPGIRSKRLSIPIFGLSYYKPDQLNAIKTLCEESFGLYYSDASLSVANTSAKLYTYLNSFLQRQAGFYYPFTYTTTYEKDGKSHTVKVDAKSDNTAFLIPSPNKNIIEWVAANPILAVILFILLGGLVFMSIKLMNNEKQKKEAERRRQQEQMSEIDRQHKDKEEMLSAKLTSQQQELDAIKKKEQLKLDAEQRKKIDLENQKRDAELAAQMSLSGNYPWFDYMMGNNIKNRFEIRKPQIVVGRAENCDLRIENPTVSKNHFQLNFKSNGEYWIKDLGSSNGLFVNGQKVQQSILRHGDFIQAGEMVLNFFI
jgi:large-conductance mechanosensitive channel